MPADPAAVKALFLDAAAIDDPAARAALLHERCGADVALLARLNALLVANDRAVENEATVTEGADDSQPTSDFRGTNEQPGSVIAGKYTLVEVIGEGGMGSVWRAKQSEPVKRFVAVKLIKAGMDSKQVLARFDAERQALALMDHPNIAKVLDGGLHEHRPYFVMELVKGVPITEYCDKCKLTPKQRLELFVPVCQAIQHAHQKGIIHRDIKPSNVLIALYDDKPVPKVIDFGIAKATGGTLTEHTIETAFGGVVGTPQYMSPEQASLNNLDIDTRSDVYSLGVLLYELLTGSPPFAPKELEKRGLLEILRVVREEEPPRPSMKLSTADALPSLSASRGTEPKKLTGLLRNELDWIVMKALEKDRARRYETANGFAADVNRYLAGEPVIAHPPSLRYRLRKYGQKNRVAIFTAILFALTLKTTTLISIWLASRAFIAENIATQERDDAITARQRESDERKKADVAKVEAQAKAAEANAVVQFFEQKVFAAARPKNQDGGLGAGVTLREAVAASVPALEKGFADQPLVEARLRMALGTTFQYLAEYDQARDQNERARTLFTRHRGPDHPDTLATMNNLANSYAALNRPAEALKLREEVLEILKRVLPKDHPDTLKSMNNLANSYAALNRPAEALKLFEEVVAIRKRVLPKDHPNTLTSMNNLAGSYARMNRPAEALKLCEEVVEIRKRVLPPNHPDTLTSMNNLANSYADLNRHAEALKLREEVLEIRKRVLPKDHPDTLMSMNNLATSYAALNRSADALKLREETLAIRKRVLPEDHPDTLLSMALLADSLIQLDRGVEAIPLIDKFLAKARTSPAVDSRLIPRAISLRLRHFQKTGDPAGCRTTAEMWEKLNRPDADSLYAAACYRAVTAAVQAKTPGADAARLAKEDADRAMQWLTLACAAGFKDAGHIRQDIDLDALRERADFKKLLVELDVKSPLPHQRK
jgi:serine/threonine protein kinase/tetratricopeptide (TPR) repeat protein